MVEDIKEMVDENDFVEIAINSTHEDVAYEALGHISDEKSFIEILLHFYHSFSVIKFLNLLSSINKK